MDVVQVHGVSIAFRRGGAGSPIVLVHGAAEDGRIWRVQLTSLARSFTVVAWDEPGAGGSSDLPATFGLADYAHCLAGLISALGLGPVTVAGISWGGTVVLELYRLYPEAVSRLVLVDTYAGWRGSLPEEEVRARVAGVRRMLSAPATEFDPTFPGMFASDPPAEFVPLLKEIAADVRPATLGHQLAIMAETDLSTVLPQITVPTLLIWGEHDVRSPLDVAQTFRASIPRARLVVLPGAGHLSHLDQPRAFTAAVRSFCQD